MTRICKRNDCFISPKRARLGLASKSFGSLVFLFPLLTAGCDLKSGQPNPEDRPKRPSDVVEFPALYARNCSGCHGADGKLGPAPPLNDKLFLAIVSDVELKRVITEGRKGTLMPPFGRDHGGSLTPVQVHVLVKGLRETWGGKPYVPQAPPPYVGTRTGNKADGADTFRMACANCHGEYGKGGQDAGPLNDPAFLALISDQALRRIIITGRPDLHMPNFAEKEDRGEEFKPLSDQDVADLVALLASWRQPARTPQEPKATPKQGNR